MTFGPGGDFQPLTMGVVANHCAVTKAGEKPDQKALNPNPNPNRTSNLTLASALAAALAVGWKRYLKRYT